MEITVRISLNNNYMIEQKIRELKMIGYSFFIFMRHTLQLRNYNSMYIYPVFYSFL